MPATISAVLIPVPRARVLQACLLLLCLAGSRPLAGMDGTAGGATPPPAPAAGGVDLSPMVTLHVQHGSSWVVLEAIQHQLGYARGDGPIRLLPADVDVFAQRLSEDLPRLPLHAVLDRVCADAHLRWCTGAGMILVDQPLPPATLQPLIAAAHPAALPPPAGQLEACAQAANTLLRCGDRDGVLAVLTALGDPALDQVAPADRPRAQAYQQGLLDALGAQVPSLTPIDRWIASPGLAILAPQCAPAIGRAWARASRGELPYTPLLCYLCGAAHLRDALPALRRIAVDPVAVVTDLDPRGPRQAAALALIQAVAIWSLGELRDTASVPALVRVLADRPTAAVLAMAVVALGRCGEASAADAILALPSAGQADLQADQYLAIAALRPAALVTLARTLHPGVAGQMPPAWWPAVGAAPVASVVPLAFAARDLQGIPNGNAWVVLQAWDALVRLPGVAPTVIAAARDQLSRATDPRLQDLDRILLASQGDQALHAQLLANTLRTPVTSQDWQPWQHPLVEIGPLTPAEEDQVLAAPAVNLARWDVTAVLHDRTDALEAILLRATTPPATGAPVEILRELVRDQEPTTCERLVQALTPPATGDAAGCLTAIGELPAWGTMVDPITQALVALLHDHRLPVAQRAAEYLARDYDDRVQVPLIAWEAQQRLEDLPASFVRSPDAPWRVPGPGRYPLRLPFAVYARQARLVLQWAKTSPEAAVQRTLVWWLGVHPLETKRPFAVDVIQGLEQLARAPDIGVAQAARTQLQAFLADAVGEHAPTLAMGLCGDDDDRASLKALDAAMAPVAAVLATPVPPVAPAAPAPPHPAHAGF